MNGILHSVRPRLSGTNLERAADHNQRITLHAIRVCGALTRVELAGITGLTAPAIANITKRLLQDGLIEEAGQRRGGRGQPPTKLVIRPDACYSIGINIDRDHITIVLVDFAGQTLARASEEIDYALPRHVKALYERSIENMLKGARVDPAKLVGIGVAVPDDLGSIDLPGRPAAYAEWEGADMAALFSGPHGPPVFTENDAAAAAMGEMQLGLGQKINSFFYILLSSGLGGGLVIDGNYVRGADGRSGEIGFMQAHRVGGGPDAQLQNIVSLSALANILSAEGFTLADAFGGETDAAACADRWISLAAQQLAEPLAAVNCLVNPAAVLLGGRLPMRLVERLAERINARMQEMAASLPAVAPVARAALSEDAPAVGAAILPFSHFLLPKPGALWKAPRSMGVGMET
ncbi:sugar kinase [Sphingobium sp. LB126]|uniref:ROK family transcriptional regulator n=1 Tax=Sphingobium sp. LB126 TaxID=1983755 RepID=UPI000C20C3EF|nr:ROK family transcriptional regulator [Sphingobium sp. LB126]PJG47750.1 sugar kinase [Sphingobium sp. LB126]